MAAGKVLTGFSLPYVALYSATGGTVTHTSGQKLARGVSVSLEPTVGDDNRFYADNITAETAPGLMTGGTVTLTVDGLLEAAEKLILGLPESDANDWYHYGDQMDVPYVSIGFICRYQSDGVVTYTPVVLTKARFQTPSLTANTQEEEIEWQTQELTADLSRDDTANHDWKVVGEAQTTEALAEAMIKAFLNITP